MPYGGVEEGLSGGAVLYERSPEGVAVITLNRPAEMNAFSIEMRNAFFNACDKAIADAEAKVIVVVGAGRAWCAGASMRDLNRLSGRVSGQEQAENRRPVFDEERSARAETGSADDYVGRPFNYAIYVPKPIIAAINGACAGAGFSLAMSFDIRFAAEGAKFASAFARRGLIAELGVSSTLPRAIGIGNAMDVLLSGRTFLADEALRLGIVQRVFPVPCFMDEVMAYAADMARNVPPNSTAIIKSQVWAHPMMDPEAALKESNRLMILSTMPTNPDFKEGVASFVEKRPPKFGALDFGSPMQRLRAELFERRLENERLRRALEAARGGPRPKL